MRCTNCQTDDGVSWNPLDDAPRLTVELIVAVCENWLCPACLDLAEAGRLPAPQTESTETTK